MQYMLGKVYNADIKSGYIIAWKAIMTIEAAASHKYSLPGLIRRSIINVVKFSV